MSHEEQHGISRRDVLRTGAVAGVTAALGGAGAAAAVPATAAPASPGLPDGNGDTAFVNGRIHTMDDDERVVDAVLIRDGVFAAVGTGVPVGDRAPRSSICRAARSYPGSSRATPTSSASPTAPATTSRSSSSRRRSLHTTGDIQ
jgi:hypothetical protein